MFSTVPKAATLCTRVWYVNIRVNAFYMWVSWKQFMYNTRLVRRIVTYTVRDIKRLCGAKIKVFCMNLMFNYWLVTILKHGVGVEGEGAWRHGRGCSSNFPHSKCFAAKWVAQILLYLTYEIQCLLTRVFDKLLGSWSQCIWPTRWVSRDFLARYLFHLQFVMMRSSGQIGRYR